MSKEITILPYSVEIEIVKLIDKKFKDDDLGVSFPNPLLREDVLELLDKYCTVVYYPIENEANNGFRLKEIPFSDGSRHDFVFINTAQTMEKQAITAAHELGHIWNVDDRVLCNVPLVEYAGLREDIINRFAAVLLIPANKFIATVQECLHQLGNNTENTISYENLLKMIVILMNHFFAPMKAVVLRLVELDIFGVEVAETLFGNREIPEHVFTNRINEIIVDLGYTNLRYPSNKKWIEGLAEKLDIAERNDLVPKSKIQVMREKFGLKPASSIVPGLDNVVLLNTQEGHDE